MEIGLRIPHTGRQATPDFVRSWSMAADRLGYDSLWGVDHLVMPQRVASKYVLPRNPATIADDAVSDLLAPNFELMTSLAFVAAVTERIRLGSAVAVLPIRNAIANARQLATVDRYSGGRLLYGIGVGWLKEEADAMGMPWDRRGARTDEHIALLRAIWTESSNHVEFHGEFWDVPPMDPEPRPHQPTIPILVGGHSEVAIDRAARLGDGWIAAGMSVERLSELLPILHEALTQHGRTPQDVPVYCGTNAKGATVDGLRRFEELGVHSMQVGLGTLDDLERFADEVLPAFR
jgi:probable F420-dependent oxidoreductase